MYTTNSVISKDGTSISYRQLGQGPGVILVHGGMQAAQNFMKLAEVLANQFTLYIPNRRGRSLSGAPGDEYGIKKECEDINALLGKTGARFIFGLSSGAIISLYSALMFQTIHKVAIYEPPFSIDSSSPDFNFVNRYNKEIAQNKLGAAFVTVIKGLDVSPMMSLIPRFIMVPIMNIGIKREAGSVADDHILLKDIIPTWHFDSMLVAETKGALDKFRQVTTDVLLLSGRKSPAFLKNAISALSEVLPNSRHIEFKNLDHMGPDNTGRPDLVADELRGFFV